MLVCDSPEFVAWRPDFSSSGQTNPQWTKLICDDVQLCNSIEWTEWLDELSVQVEVCEQCGYTGCASGGYVRVSRLAYHLIWTPPRLEHPDDAWEKEQYTPSSSLREHGAVAFAVADWENWRAQFPNLPPAEAFPRSERRDLCAAWAFSAPFTSDGAPGSDFLGMVREQIVAAELTTNEEALRRLGTLVTWFAADQDAFVDGELVRANEDDRLEVLHLDVPDGHTTQLREWRPYAVHESRLTLPFSDRWVLTPGPIDVQ